VIKKLLEISKSAASHRDSSGCFSSLAALGSIISLRRAAGIRRRETGYRISGEILFMSDKRTRFVLRLLAVIFAAAFASVACRVERSDTPKNLIVVNAPASGKVSRIFVAEGTSVAEKASLIEITAAPVATASAGDQRGESTGGDNMESEIKAAEERLQRAAVELQRIEPLVIAGGAPQSHLDAARAEYQEAQERLDELGRRKREAVPQYSNTQAGRNVGSQRDPAKVTIVPAPKAGNVRVISVRVGQSVKAGDPMVTILAGN